MGTPPAIGRTAPARREELIGYGVVPNAPDRASALMDINKAAIATR